MDKKYFYIIHRDGQIFEIEFSENRLASAIKQWQESGLIIYPTLGIAINAVDITKILNSDQYQNYVDSVQPAMFVKNGTWFDIKERKPIRHETWKKKEIENTTRIDEPKEDVQKSPEEIKEILNRNKPEFLNKPYKDD